MEKRNSILEKLRHSKMGEIFKSKQLLFIFVSLPEVYSISDANKYEHYKEKKSVLLSKVADLSTVGSGSTFSSNYKRTKL